MHALHSRLALALILHCPGIRRRPEYRSTAEHMLHLCKDKDYAVPALASAYTLAVSQAAKRFRVRAPKQLRPAHFQVPCVGPNACSLPCQNVLAINCVKRGIGGCMSGH